MSYTELKKIIEEEQYYEYLQLPRSLAEELDFENKYDYKGVQARFEYIRSFFEDNSFADIVNIGGNCGYFSLSLLDENLAEEAIVYDIKADILEIGEKIARAMNISDRCKFEEKMINLEELKTLPPANVLIFQNVLHHAGDYFDQELVKDIGWGEYARQFMAGLRELYDYAVFAVGFKWNKPKYWQVDKDKRRGEFQNILADADWEIISDANVYDLMSSKGECDYKNFIHEDGQEEFTKGELGALWDLITFNAIKHVSILLGPTSEKLKESVPALSEAAAEIAKMYHIYLLK